MKSTIGVTIWNLIESIIRFFMNIILRIFKIKWDEKHWDKFMQFVKFCFVGLSSAVVMYFFYMIVWITLKNYFVANCVGFFFSTFNSYIWNSKVVFKAKDGAKAAFVSYIKTLSLYAITGLVLSNILLHVWIELLHVSPAIAPLINIIIVTPLNYVLNKFWAFKK